MKPARMGGGSHLERVEAAAAHLERIGIGEPEVALILGSGLGSIADSLSDRISVPVSEIPSYPVPGVTGHAGQVSSGRFDGVPCLVFQGRVHLYEGRTIEDVVFPIDLAKRLGVARVLLTNSAGGIASDLRSGSLMLIADHLSLIPPGSSGVDVGRSQKAYDPEMLDDLEHAALHAGIGIRRGTYAWTIGPSYETPAEIRALRRIGADAVGMSTVPEVLRASALSLPCAAISAITNPASGLSPQRLHHQEVIKVATQIADSLVVLVSQYLRVHAR